MQLRLDSLRLRCSEHSIDRNDRLCRVCFTTRHHGVRIEDELHIMLECPRYRRIRTKPIWQPLFGEGRHANMHLFMTQPDQFKLCHFVCAVLRRRQQLLDQIHDTPHVDFYDSSEDEDL